MNTMERINSNLMNKIVKEVDIYSNNNKLKILRRRVIIKVHQRVYYLESKS